MKRHFLLLVTFLALGLRLLAGPHPCRASHVEPSPSVPEAKVSSCHQAEPMAPAAASVSSSAAHDCCGQDRACEIACQMPAAVLELEVDSPAVGPVAQAVAPACERFLPLLVHAIDHVPLA